MVDLLCCVPELYMLKMCLFGQCSIVLMLHYLTGVYNLVISCYPSDQILLCSIEELQRLLKDKEAYNAFFNSLDQVKTQNNVSSVACATFFYKCDTGLTRVC
jgi:hypothetical protein